MTRYAIILGVEHYDNFTQTPFAHSDASLLHKTLTEICDYPVQHALLLQLGLDKQMEPSEILNKIKETVSNLRSGDTVLFYFAGHGHLLDNRAYLILPKTNPHAYETTALALDDITNELRPPKRICFRILDACHSGLDVRGDIDVPDSKGFIRSVTHDATGWVTLAACRDDEYSSSDVDIGHGVFTHYLCEYIRSLKPGDPVYPEMLKVDIVDQVKNHANRLGVIQTPTLNASISGNITLAIRRAEAHPADKKSKDSEESNVLKQRIKDLRKVPEVIQEDTLTELLGRLASSLQNKLKEHNDLSPDPISVGEPILADKIPQQMRPAIVDFARQKGLRVRHKLGRLEEEYEVPLFAFESAISSFFPKRKVRQVHYDFSQSSDLPKSALVLNVPGDGRSIPNLQLLIYVIPLQIACCLLISTFREQWAPQEGQLELLCQSYQMYQPGMKIEKADELASFASTQIVENLKKYVVTRANQLERELEE